MAFAHFASAAQAFLPGLASLFMGEDEEEVQKDDCEEMDGEDGDDDNSYRYEEVDEADQEMISDDDSIAEECVDDASSADGAEEESELEWTEDEIPGEWSEDDFTGEWTDAENEGECADEAKAEMMDDNAKARGDDLEGEKCQSNDAKKNDSVTEGKQTLRFAQGSVMRRGPSRQSGRHVAVLNGPCRQSGRSVALRGPSRRSGRCAAVLAGDTVPSAPATSSPGALTEGRPARTHVQKQPVAGPRRAILPRRRPAPAKAAPVEVKVCVVGCSIVTEMPVDIAPKPLDPSAPDNKENVTPQQSLAEARAQGELTVQRLKTLPKFTPPTWSGTLPVPESPEPSSRTLAVESQGCSPHKVAGAPNTAESFVNGWVDSENRQPENFGKLLAEVFPRQSFSEWPQEGDAHPKLLEDTLQSLPSAFLLDQHQGDAHPKVLEDTLQTLPSALLLEQLQTAKTSEDAHNTSVVDSSATTVSAHSVFESDYCFDHTGLSNTQPLFPEIVLGAALTSHLSVSGLSDTHHVLPQIVVSASPTSDITPHQKWRSPTADMRHTM